jgi:CheY-like chemotaxis protein
MTRILLIEDNEANLELMSYLLQAYGYAIETAGDGAAGLRAAQRQRPDLIICDVQIPIMDGYEVAHRLAQHPQLADVPRIAVTAFAMVDDRRKALDAGFHGYFTKPIAPETFVEQIQSFLTPAQRRVQRASAPDAQANPTAPAARGYTVLVVDDNAINLEFAAALLGRSGYEVVTAPGMAAAIGRLRECKPDLILSDVCMTDGSGYDFIKHVKADPELRDIPFVFLTSTMVAPRERTRGLELGAARYLVRPIEPHLLLQEVGICLGNPVER